MARSVSPSEMITEGQIGKIQDLLGSGMRFNEKVFDRTLIQRVIEKTGNRLVCEFLRALQVHVLASSDMIVRKVKANRKLTPLQMLEATRQDYERYSDPEVIASMFPGYWGDEVELCLFKFDDEVVGIDNLGLQTLEQVYSLRNLWPADPYSVCQLIIDDWSGSFLDAHPRVQTYWRDDAGRVNTICCAGRVDGGTRRVLVGRGQVTDGWFVGVHKSTPIAPLSA
ncbi:MAG: hypothetical protein V1846_02475 [Candidatus Komeilibacteria bacterium]